MQYLEELSIGILKSIRGRRVDLPPDRAQCEWRSETSFEYLSRSFCGLKGLESRARGLRNRSKGENIVPSGGSHFDGAFEILLAFDLPKVKVLFGGSDRGPAVHRADRLQGDVSPQKMHDLRKRICPIHLDAFHHGRFRRIVPRNDESCRCAMAFLQSLHPTLPTPHQQRIDGCEGCRA
jgi:hypothetical protein